MNLKERTLLQKKMFALIELWLKDQDSPAAFCKSNNIKVWQFSYWKRKYLERNKSKKGFAAIKVESQNTFGTEEQKIEIRYSSGMIIHLPESLSLNLLQFLSSL